MRAFLYWFLLAGVLLALWAQWRLRSAYRRWSGQASATRSLTGAGAAREILDAAGLADVPVERTGGHLTDHYDPQMSAQELAGVGKVLNAAAWTYIAAFTLTFAQLLRLLRWGRLIRPPF
jgi:Zn-dependent membrane protease YugP